MAKKKVGKRVSGPLGGQANDAPKVARPEWESIEVEFFAREADLYRVSPVETFDDLDGD
jgi:hypothetical protein